MDTNPDTIQSASSAGRRRAGRTSGSADLFSGGGRSRWAVVVVYAVAMAWVEAAVVLDLRTITGQMDPYSPQPLLAIGNTGIAEVIREFATMIMLGAVGWLAGRSWRSRIGYGLVAFGVWDIFYYIFLRPLTAWPRSLLDWDLLFLIPLPWWGPVWAPVSIALLMVLGGTLVAQFDEPTAPLWPRRRARYLGTLGVAVALYVFMTDALRVANQGLPALRALLPVWFNWPLFVAAWLLMAAPLVDLLVQVRKRQGQTAPGLTGIEPSAPPAGTEAAL